MQRNLLITAYSILSSSVLLFSVLGAAVAINSHAHIAIVGNESVTFHGDHAVIDLNHSSYSVGWILTETSGSGIQELNFTHISYKRIVKSGINSFSVIENSSYFQVAQIYSFHKESIDASIAVQNLQNRNVTLMASFYVELPSSHAYALMDGIVPKLTKYMGTGSEAVIPMNYWGLNIGHLNINWQNEASIFSGSLVRNTTSGIEVISDFGPISISHNETYSVDPLISSAPSLESIAGPIPTSSLNNVTATPAYLPDGDGDGDACHCDNDGSPPPTDTTDYDGDTDPDTDGSPPRGLSLSAVTPIDTVPGNTMYVNASLSSVGSGGVTFHLQAQTFSGSWTTKMSQNNPNFIWTAEYGYKAVRESASNNYGGTNSNSQKVYIFNYPETSVNGNAYSASTSEPIAEYSPGVNNNAQGTITKMWSPISTDVPLYLGTVANWNSSYAVGIWSFNQALTVYGTYGFTNGTGTSTNVVNFDVYNVQNSIQSGSSTQIMTYLLDYLANIANSFTYGLIPPPGLIFNDYGSTQTTQHAIPIYFNDTGTGPSTTAKVPSWLPITEGALSNTPIRDFGIKTWNDAFPTNSGTNYHMFLEYSVSISFLESESSSAVYTSSSTVIFQMYVGAAS